MDREPAPRTFSNLDVRFTEQPRDLLGVLSPSDGSLRGLLDPETPISTGPVFAVQAKAHCDRGWYHFEKEMYDQAFADFTKSIELNPSYAFAYNNRGVAYSKLHDWDRAIADYTKALELDPDHQWAQTGLVNTYVDRAQCCVPRPIGSWVMTVKLLSTSRKRRQPFALAKPSSGSSIPIGIRRSPWRPRRSAWIPASLTATCGGALPT